jgi:Carboxypeptidase regulatory-like domain
MGTSSMRMTTTRKKTKRTFSRSLEFFRHPLPPFDHPIHRGIPAFAMLMFFLAPGAVPGTAAGNETRSDSHAHDFVIFVSVFTAEGFALPGAKVRVRRTDEQKFRWEAISDSRGELGVRVKQGAQYELTIEAHDFKPQTRKIDAREGNREDLTFQMEPLAGGKP